MDGVNPKKRRAPGDVPYHPTNNHASRARNTQRTTEAYSVFNEQDLFPPGPRVPHVDTMDEEVLSPPPSAKKRDPPPPANPMNDVQTFATDISSPANLDAPCHPHLCRPFWLPLLPAHADHQEDDQHRVRKPAELYLESLFCSKTLIQLDLTRITHFNPHNGMMIRPLQTAALPRSNAPLSAADVEKAALGIYTEAALTSFASGLKRWASSNSSRTPFSPPEYIRRTQNPPQSNSAQLQAPPLGDTISSAALSSPKWRDIVDPTVESSWKTLDLPLLATSFKRVDQSYEDPTSESSLGENLVIYNMNLLSDTIGPLIKLCHWICTLFESETGIVERFRLAPRVRLDDTLLAVARIMLAMLTFMAKPEEEFVLEHRAPATQIGCYRADGGADRTITMRTMTDEVDPTKVFSLLDCLPFMRAFLPIMALSKNADTQPEATDNEDDDIPSSGLSFVFVSDGLHSLSGIARAIGLGELVDPLIYVASVNSPNIGMLMTRSQYNELVFPFLSAFLHSSSRGSLEYCVTAFVSTIRESHAFKDDDDATLAPNYAAAYPFFLRAALNAMHNWAATNNCHALFSPSSIHIFNPSPFAGCVGTLMPVEAADKAWGPFRSLMDEYSPETVSAETLVNATHTGGGVTSSSSDNGNHHHPQKIGTSQNFHRTKLSVILI